MVQLTSCGGGSYALMTALCVGAVVSWGVQTTVGEVLKEWARNQFRRRFSPRTASESKRSHRYPVIAANDIEQVERFSRWRTAAFWALWSIERHMVPACLNLARVDIELIELDERTRVGGDKGLIAAIEEKDRRFGLSRMWVLDAYELVRSIEERLRSKKGATLHDRAFELKVRFERVRMPLAKFRPANRHPDTWPIASPVEYPLTRGVAWRVKDDEYIERAELADGLLKFLEELAMRNRIVINQSRTRETSRTVTQ